MASWMLWLAGCCDFIFTTLRAGCYFLLDAMACWMLWLPGCYGLLNAMACWLLWLAGCYGLLNAMACWVLWLTACCDYSFIISLAGCYGLLDTVACISICKKNNLIGVAPGSFFWVLQKNEKDVSVNNIGDFWDSPFGAANTPPWERVLHTILTKAWQMCTHCNKFGWPWWADIIK